MITLNVQITEVEREIKKRREVYGRLVAAGKMRQSIADMQIEIMEAVKESLEQLRT